MWAKYSLVACLMASVAVARPRKMGEGDPLSQTSRVTAFVINDKGEPSVECWEITNMVDSQQMTRRDGSKATAHTMSLATRSELDGLDILTWPSLSPIWPAPTGSDLHAEYLDLSNTFNLFSIQGGLINFNFYTARFGARKDDTEIETHIFSLENGDDWFYFEDSTSESITWTADNPSPFEISTISATETEMLRLRFQRTPKHDVIHKGACKFTGIKIPAEDSSSTFGSRTSRIHNPLTVQVKIDDFL